MIRTQNTNLEAGTEVEVMDEYCLLSSICGLLILLFYTTHDHLSKGHNTHTGLVVLH